MYKGEGGGGGLMPPHYEVSWKFWKGDLLYEAKTCSSWRSSENHSINCLYYILITSSPENLNSCKNWNKIMLLLGSSQKVKGRGGGEWAGGKGGGSASFEPSQRGGSSHFWDTRQMGHDSFRLGIIYWNLNFEVSRDGIWADKALF